MLKTGTNVFFQEPTSDTRLLRLSTVIEVEGQSFTVEFGEHPISLGADRELLCFYHDRRELMQRLVRVLAVVAEEPRLVAKLVAVGDPISAESRQTCRVATVSADILADVGEERGLSVEDVSAEGFSVIAKGSYAIGARFPVSILFEGDRYSGEASVRSVRELEPGRVRYGLRASEDDSGAGDLLDGLHDVNLALERRQLKRNGGVG